VEQVWSEGETGPFAIICSEAVFEPHTVLHLPMNALNVSGAALGVPHLNSYDGFIKNREKFNVVPYDNIMDKYIPFVKERIEARCAR
jgi:hypothetical protein